MEKLLSSMCAMFLILYVPGARSQGQFFTCENNRANLTCAGSTIINIVSAMYGRESGRSDICPGEGTATASTCTSSVSLSTMRTLCQGKKSCSVWARSEDFGGDPCPQIFKYLDVNYQCVADPAATSSTAEPTSSTVTQQPTPSTTQSTPAAEPSSTSSDPTPAPTDAPTTIRSTGKGKNGRRRRRRRRNRRRKEKKRHPWSKFYIEPPSKY